MTQTEYGFNTFGKVAPDTNPRFLEIRELETISEDGRVVQQNVKFLSIVDMSKISLVATTDYFQKESGIEAEINGFCMLNGYLNLLPVNRYSTDGQSNTFFVNGEESDFDSVYQYLATLVS